MHPPSLLDPCEACGGAAWRPAEHGAGDVPCERCRDAPRVLSACSGVGGLDLGLHRAGLRTVGLCEVDPWRREVLARHWPGVPCHPDLVELAAWAKRDPDAVRAWCGGQPDLLAGGTPCQDLSSAGKRAGLEGPKSGLYWHFAELRLALGVEWCLWENVAGSLNSNGGLDFALVLGAFVGADVAVPDGGFGGAGVAAGPWGGCVWRLLNAQHFGVPQRRRRVFVVGRLGGPCPPEVLFERGRDGRDSQAGDAAGPRPAWAAAAAARGGGGGGVGDGRRRGVGARGGGGAAVGGRVAGGVGGLDVSGTLGSPTPGGGQRSTDVEFGALVGPVADDADGAPAGGGDGRADYVPDVAGTVAAHLARGLNSKAEEGHLVATDGVSPGGRHEGPGGEHGGIADAEGRVGAGHTEPPSGDGGRAGDRVSHGAASGAAGPAAGRRAGADADAGGDPGGEPGGDAAETYAN